MIFKEVCLNRFNFLGVNYDFLSAASKYGTCIWQALVEVLMDNLIILKIRNRTFSRVPLSYPIGKTWSLGECMGWTKRAILGFAIIAPLTSQVDCPWIRGATAIGCLGGTAG